MLSDRRYDDNNNDDDGGEEEITFKPKNHTTPPAAAVPPPSPLRFESLLTAQLGLPRQAIGPMGSTQRLALEAILEHPSYHSLDKAKQVAFQRQEWFGDTILQFCVSQLLMDRFPYEPESLLNRRRTAIVRECNLAAWGRFVHLDSLLLVKGQVTDSIVADSVEALVAAVFRDGGGLVSAALMCQHIADFEARQHLQPPTASANADDATTTTTTASPSALNPKAILQDWCVAALGRVPSFAFHPQSGPDHRPVFTVDATVDFGGDGGGVVTHQGSGPTKQLAEEAACLGFFPKPQQQPVVVRTLPLETNIKGKLQERLGGAVVDYALIHKLGPVHAPFEVRVQVNKYLAPVFAFGATKKEAEAQAAYKLIEMLDAQPPQPAPALAPPRVASPPPPAFADSFGAATATATAMMMESLSLSANNPKGRLQELLINHHPARPQPVYALVGRSGPDHAPQFEVAVSVCNERWGVGTSRTKRQAEELAALDALAEHEDELLRGGARAAAAPSSPAHSTYSSSSSHTAGNNSSSTWSSPSSSAYAPSAAAASNITNPKGYLQERAIKLFSATPSYVECTHSQHGQGIFTFDVLLNGQVRGRGAASTKKEAQEKAAREAIRTLGM